MPGTLLLRPSVSRDGLQRLVVQTRRDANDAQTAIIPLPGDRTVVSKVYGCQTRQMQIVRRSLQRGRGAESYVRLGCRSVSDFLSLGGRPRGFSGGLGGRRWILYMFRLLQRYSDQGRLPEEWPSGSRACQRKRCQRCANQHRVERQRLKRTDTQPRIFMTADTGCPTEGQENEDVEEDGRMKKCPGFEPLPGGNKPCKYSGKWPSEIQPLRKRCELCAYRQNSANSTKREGVKRNKKGQHPSAGISGYEECEASRKDTDTESVIGLPLTNTTISPATNSYHLSQSWATSTNWGRFTMPFESQHGFEGSLSHVPEVMEAGTFAPFNSDLGQYAVLEEAGRGLAATCTESRVQHGAYQPGMAGLSQIFIGHRRNKPTYFSTSVDVTALRHEGDSNLLDPYPGVPQHFLSQNCMLGDVNDIDYGN